jgi:hypothetical protein
MYIIYMYTYIYIIYTYFPKIVRKRQEAIDNRPKYINKCVTEQQTQNDNNCKVNMFTLIIFRKIQIKAKWMIILHLSDWQTLFRSLIIPIVIEKVSQCEWAPIHVYGHILWYNLFDFGASCLAGRCSTPWAISPALLALVIFGDSISLLSQTGLDHDSPSHQSWDDRGVPPYLAFSIKMRSP